MIFKGNFLYTPALGELTVREGENRGAAGGKCVGFSGGGSPRSTPGSR